MFFGNLTGKSQRFSLRAASPPWWVLRVHPRLSVADWILTWLRFLRKPYKYFDQFRKVKEGLNSGQFDSSGLGHRVQRDFCFCVLQWPGHMMNVRAEDLTGADNVQAIAFGQEMFERAFFPLPWLGDGPVASVKFSRAWILQAP